MKKQKQIRLSVNYDVAHAVYLQIHKTEPQSDADLSQCLWMLLLFTLNDILPPEPEEDALLIPAADDARLATTEH